MITQPKTLNNKIQKGANKKTKRLAFTGTINSLRNNFKASEIGCNKPQKPTRLGPLRLWIAPKTFRSATVKNATLIKIHKIFIITKIIYVRIIINYFKHKKTKIYNNEKTLSNINKFIKKVNFFKFN